MRHSLSHALHSLRGPHFPGRPSKRAALTEKNQQVLATEKAFDVEVHDRLLQLHITGEHEFLTLSWLHDAVKLLHFTCAQISNFLPKIACTEHESSLLESNLEDTLNLLDACNGLKEVLNDVQHYVMLVKYAARAAVDLEDASEEELKTKLLRLHCALIKSGEFMHAKVEENSRHREGRSKLETCSSMLRRMGGPLPEALFGSKRAASNALFNEMYAVKVLAIFVCSVLAIALSVKPKRPLSCVHMADQPNWLEALKTIQQNVKNLTDNGIEDGKVALLKELDDVRVPNEELCEMLNKIVKHETPTAEVDRVGISQSCKKLSKDSDELQKGLVILQQHMDGLFRMLVTIRVDFLDCLCHV